MLEDWITDLISDPKPNLLKKPISTEQKEYTIALMDRGIVYTGVFPISNRPDGEGYYYFVFDKSIEL